MLKTPTQTAALQEALNGPDFDCSPRYEAIVAQRKILALWVHSNHERTIWQLTLTENDDTGGWLEDAPRKGAALEEHLFDSFENAFAAFGEIAEREIRALPHFNAA